ncbi:hypothetical protein NWP22_01180 [Anabaenopsis tanganyikae CS-531]|uniref:Uncharacterized protein n=1 Tax=Anabaenopsis tanganyikae CS-531 TaxID=2785304 RepID=A0ABT6K9P0_9CYAN|nr:hypothetical protein [Anabaenopsis tanganyikae]MDH6104508.1 hypothetical protein [Anabaenopsis tanganyikae CS-531]
MIKLSPVWATYEDLSTQESTFSGLSLLAGEFIPQLMTVDCHTSSQSTVNSQQSTVNSQPSTVNGMANATLSLSTPLTDHRQPSTINKSKPTPE